MSWMKTVSIFTRGAVGTGGFTLVSCSLALQVEKCGHRLVYWLAPEKYAHVETACGLTDGQLLEARELARASTLTNRNPAVPDVRINNSHFIAFG